ncbi:hypothetical protein BN130_608 [Cronobacter malonaticus 507]|nr:hypothetical protein BN130_608 [Cronobacter malonaticus 507]
MFRVGVQHGGVGPAGHALFWKDSGDGLAFVFQRVGLVRPGAGGHDALVFEIAHLNGGVMPVAVDQLMLVAQHFQHRAILRLGQLIRIGNAKLRLSGFNVKRRIGDINWPVVSLHAPLVGFAVRQRLLHKQHRPAVRRRRERFGVVHQQVWPPLVRRAVDFTVEIKPFAFNEARVDIFPVRDERGVNRLHAFAHNKAQRGVAGGRDQIVTALRHQADHFIRRGGGFHIHGAAGRFFKFGHPVIGFVGLAAFDITRPRDDIEAAFTLAELGRRLGGAGDAGRQAQRNNYYK